MPQIDAARLLGDLYALRKIGAYKTGVHRPTLSPEDIQSRHWLADKLTAAGLDAGIDGIANVFGRDRAPGRKLLMGSHLETQPHAGWLDGAMGVVYGLRRCASLAGESTWSPGATRRGISAPSPAAAPSAACCPRPRSTRWSAARTV